MRTDRHEEANTVQPLITDTAGEFQFCPLVGGSSSDYFLVTIPFG
jgi:hypothetical protein